MIISNEKIRYFYLIGDNVEHALGGDLFQDPGEAHDVMMDCGYAFTYEIKAYLDPASISMFGDNE